jgi:uncharacterized membrane protein YbhN (UPF0104 family)
MAHEQRPFCARTTRRSVVVSAVGAAAVGVVLAIVLAGQRDEFSAALGAASLLVLLVSAALQAVALVARSEAWHTCVTAAGGTVPRRRLYWAASMGNLGSLVNTNLAAAARIAVLRRTAPRESPRVGALVTAEIPIVAVEACLAVLTCFTLVGPLGLPWWAPLVAFVTAAGLATGLCACADGHRHGAWCGLAVLRSVRGRIRLVVFVLLAVAAQIARNWLMLHAVGVDASLFDAIAVLITMVTLSQLPFGPSVGAAAVVLILGANGVAATTAAGVLLTVTGTAGALAYAGWAALDRLCRSPATAAARRVAAPRPVVAIQVERT